MENLKMLLNEYETGKIISDNTKKTIDIIKNDSLSQIDQLKGKIDMLNSVNDNKIKELERNLFIANNEIKEKTKTIADSEKIILKQEDKIEELNKLISKLNKEIFNKELSIKKNENYSMQLMAIINEQKLKMKTIKNKNIELNNDEIIILKRQIENLKNDIELKENIILTMKKGQKNLQNKYLNICYSVRRKEQEDLLRQAKILQKQRENISYKVKNRPIIKSSSYSAFTLKKNGNKNRNKKNNIENKNKMNTLPLPKINNNSEFEEGNKENLEIKEIK